MQSLEGMLDVYVEAELITLALRQIIDNGWKYPPPAQLTSLNAKAGRDRMMNRIGDEGSGIPERRREEDFNAYYRHFAFRRKVRGNGLAHRGDIWIEPMPGFCIALPGSRQ